MLLLGLKRLIERMTDQCWNGYMAGEMKHVDHCFPASRGLSRRLVVRDLF